MTLLVGPASGDIKSVPVAYHLSPEPAVGNEPNRRRDRSVAGLLPGMNRFSDNPEVKQRIRSAFLARLRAVPYARIPISDLAGRLAMSRQNFNRYYASKEEILLDVVDDTVELLYQVIDGNVARFGVDATQLTELLLPVLRQHRATLREVLNSGTDDVVFAHLGRFIRRIVGRLLREKNRTAANQNDLDVVIATLSGGCFHLG